MEETQMTPNRKELRRFGITTGAIVAILFGLLLPWLLARAFEPWPWVLAVVLWVWAILWPDTLRPVYRAWIGVGHVLAWINSRVILGAMFFLLVMPIGLVMRLMGKDPMARKISDELSTYRIQSRVTSKKHIERPF